jgi:hypothetical protein
MAYRDFGRDSGHPAKLNFGDCFAYIDAITTGVIATSAGTGNVNVGSSSAGVIGLSTQPNLLGVDASITNAASSGNVTVNLAGAVTAANGVEAVNAGSGTVFVGTGAVTGTSAPNSVGIAANAASVLGNSVPSKVSST